MSDETLISIKVLHREYNIKCPAAQQQELLEAATYLNEQMKKLNQNTAVVNSEQLAIVTALNISHECLKLKKQKDQYNETVSQRLQDLQQRVENVVGKTEESLV